MGREDPISDKYPRKFGKYHLLGPLAQGGMGALYLAVAGDRGLERMMVIKTVLPHLADNEYLARFRDEAKVVIKLSHGNLIPVFDAGQIGGELFLAMDFVEGRDLRAVWNRCAKKQVAFPVDVAVYIVKELCRGLAYAHAFPDLQLVHRDISPPNVLISFSGEVKLTDFGLASSTLKLEKTAPGIIYGKVAYMSPEQARGEKLDGRSDQYATAIVLWELLTGRQLFPPGKDQPQDLLARAKNPEVLRPSKRAPRVPPELDDICVRALAADRNGRYPTCDDMRQALQSWLAVNAPTTDATRLSTFLHDLFSEDIERERTEREQLIQSVRRRALTLPPTDELRQLVERSAPIIVTEAGAGNPAVRQPGSIGRRSTDREDQLNDRRQQGDRRALARPSGSPSNAPATAVAAASEIALDEIDPNVLGKVIDGRYRIEELIGEGGMGKVYLAEHVEIGKRVAVKVLHPSYSRLPDLVERFRREARAASKIGHPHIVDVTDSGTTEDGAVYFVMEYLEGVELGSIIEREGALDAARAIRIASQICRALSAAHAQSIIHRDLKPENIFLINRDGAADFVKVLDFGIAKTTEAEQARERKLTSPGMAMGTPEYMSPEQAAGRAADARCDVYALGAIAYEMLTGVPPYQGDNFMEILTKKATVDPVPPVVLKPSIPDAVNALVMAAMSRNPDDRPQTMEGFEYELTKCLAGRGAAVAQILGLGTDINPQLVANLNPGISTRNLDEGTVSRPASSPGIVMPDPHGTHYGRAPTNSPVVYATPVPGVLEGVNLSERHTSTMGTQRPSGAMPVAAYAPPQEMQLSPSTVVAAQARGGSAMGWVLLALLLFGGVGVVLYVASGERDGQRQVPAVQIDAASGSAMDPDGSATKPMLDKPDKGKPGKDDKDKDKDKDKGAALPPDKAVVPPAGSGSAVGAQPGSGNAIAATPPGDDDKTAPANKDKGKKGDKDKPADKDKADKDKAPEKPDLKGKKAATSETDAKQILKAADKLRDAGKFGAAADEYARVAASAYLPSAGLLGQARVAFEQKQFEKAALYAQSAMKAGADMVTAGMVRAAALSRVGRAQEAVNIYQGLVKKASGRKLVEVKAAIEQLRVDCKSCKFE
jgi:serine/threonine protein kinase